MNVNDAESLQPAAPSTPETAEDLLSLARRLAERGTPALKRIDEASLLAAWIETVATFRDPAAEERRRLDPVLEQSSGLSTAGLREGLDVVLGGVDRPHAEALFARGAATPGSDRVGTTVVVLAANLPGLACQPLLPVLARRRPALLKVASAEPFFAHHFVQRLVRTEPALREGIAVRCWPGGDRRLEAPLWEVARDVVVYGGRGTIDDVRGRTPSKLIEFGPRWSFAVVDRGEDPSSVAAGLARDVALFDQRGCLSLHAVFTDGDPDALARDLLRQLHRLSHRLPPGRIEVSVLSGLQQLLLEARMRGLEIHGFELGAGTVVVEAPGAAPRPAPGGRALRIYPCRELGEIPGRLLPWRGQLQGASLCGPRSQALEVPLRELGVSRFAGAGELQSADASWRNGGIDLLEVL